MKHPARKVHHSIARSLVPWLPRASHALGNTASIPFCRARPRGARVLRDHTTSGRLSRLATPTAALFAGLFLVLAATSVQAAAAPKTPPTKAAMQTMAPAPTPTAAPAPTPARASTGQASAGTPSLAPMADPGPSEPPAPAAGATTSTKAGGQEGGDKSKMRLRYQQDHSLTSILVPISFFLCILLLVGTIQYMSLRKDRNKHRTLQLMVERGAQIPVELITSQKRRGSDLRRGLVLVGTGLGITLFLLMTKDARSSGAFGLGLIPALIGCGYLLAWKLEGRNAHEQPQQRATYTDVDHFARTQPDEPDVDETRK